MPNSPIQFETKTSDPIELDGKSLVVRSRALQLRFPGSTGGVIWNRPVSVSVHTTDGHDQTLPIQDVTRLAEIAIFAVALFGALLIGLVIRNSHER